MQFLLYEVVARIFAIFLLVGSVRKLKVSFDRRQITYFYGYDTIEWLLGWDWDRTTVYSRDATPVRYWMVTLYEVILSAGCIYVALFGWFHPETLSHRVIQ